MGNNAARIRAMVTLTTAIGATLLVAQTGHAKSTGSPVDAKAALSIPANATFAASNDVPRIDLETLGYDVKCSGSNDGIAVSLNDGDPPLAVALATAEHTQIVGGASGAFDYDELAQCDPEYIVDWAPYTIPTAPDYTASELQAQQTSPQGTDDSALAPTIWIFSPDDDPGTQYGVGDGATSGPVASIWKTWFMDFAVEMQRQGLSGAVDRAQEVLARLDLRAGAIRAQVRGIRVAAISASPQSWGMGNVYYPQDNGFYGPDLGLTPALLPADDYGPNGPTDCLPGDPPHDCTSSSLSNEDYYLLDDAYVLVVDATTTDFSGLTSDPLFADIPAVKAGRYVLDPGEIRATPLTAAWDYTLVEKALEINEYHATVAGDPGATASVTLNPATKKLCYALDPTAGSTPSDAITLSEPGTETKSAPTVMTLTKRATYVNPEAGFSGWNTKPATLQAVGCVQVTSAFATALISKPYTAVLGFGSGKGTLRRGAADPVYGS